jgi:hypothetical protein
MDEARLSADVANYTRDVEAFQRVSKRMGLKHRPSTVVEMMGLQHDQMERLIRVLEGIEDVKRFQVGYPSFALVACSDFYLPGRACAYRSVGAGSIPGS